MNFRRTTRRCDARLKGGSIADSCRGEHMSGGLSHRRPKIAVARSGGQGRPHLRAARRACP